MPADPTEPLRASQLLGLRVHDRAGHVVGRIADLHTERDPDGRELLTAAIVTTGRWGRLLGYERREVTGPWLLERLAHLIIRRHSRHIRLDDLGDGWPPDPGRGTPRQR